MGRDQFFNAERVKLGVGKMLVPDADASTIADAARAVLDDASYDSRGEADGDDDHELRRRFGRARGCAGTGRPNS